MTALSRRSLIAASAAAGYTLLAGTRPKIAFASGGEAESCSIGYPPQMTAEQYIAFIEKYGGEWITYSLGEDDVLSIELGPEEIEYDPWSRSVTAVSIAVYVGGTLIGYLICSVVDGVVKAVTGKTGSEHVADAIKFVLGKKVPINRKVILSSKNYPANPQSKCNDWWW